VELLNQRIFYNLFNSMRKQARDIYEDETAIALISEGKPYWIWFKNNAVDGGEMRRFFDAFFKKHEWTDTGVIANKDVREICSERSGSVCKKRELAVYYLNGTKKHSNSAGKLRAASGKDMDLINAWMAAFYKEALFSELPEAGQNESKNENDNHGKLFILENNEPCAMGMLCEPAYGFCRLNLIYTPVHLRRQGYAKTVVNALVNRVYRNGDKPFLITDTENTAANGLYKGLGFKEVGRFIWVVI
jgi:predicted GNAT family acetyltransferase